MVINYSNSMLQSAAREQTELFIYLYKIETFAEDCRQLNAHTLANTNCQFIKFQTSSLSDDVIQLGQQLLLDYAFNFF